MIFSKVKCWVHQENNWKICETLRKNNDHYLVVSSHKTLSLLLKPLCAAPWSQSKVITIFNFVSINLLAFFIILSCLYLWTIFFTFTKFWILHNTFIFFLDQSFYLAECKMVCYLICLLYTLYMCHTIYDLIAFFRAQDWTLGKSTWYLALYWNV